MELIVCRHTQTDHNSQRVYSGQIDIELNDTGRKQANTLADEIVGLANQVADGGLIRAIVSSDLQRAAYLARAIGARIGVTPQLTPDLREVHIGSMAGMVREEALKRFPEERHKTANPHFDFTDIGGEDAHTVLRRQHAVLDMLRETYGHGQCFVVIGHGTALRLLFKEDLGLIDKLHDQGDFQKVVY